MTPTDALHCTGIRKIGYGKEDIEKNACEHLT